MALSAKVNSDKAKSANTNWNSLVYGSIGSGNSSLPRSNRDEGDFFKTLKPRKQEETLGADSSRYAETTNVDAGGAGRVEASVEASFDCIRDCFVTGKWDKSEDAAQRLQDDDELDAGDFDVDEDFDDDDNDDDEDDDDEDEDDEDDDEDEEKGDEKTGDKASAAPKKAKKKRSEMTKRERLMAKKRRLKERFDAELDESKSLDKDGAKFSAKDHDDHDYDTLLKETSRQAELTRLEFERMDEAQRVDFEGFRAGMYVRVELRRVPFELVDAFDARRILLLGALLPTESNSGCVQVRMKKHRWHGKILKARNPIVVSLGWRRFQTLPLYFIQDHNMRNRYLKYTPQHMHCHAAFWGLFSK